MAGQLILGLTILVGLHELGHMLTAKWFGMRVEKYAIGFPPKLLSKQIGETEYMIGAIPLGGFVKISGMVDESLDTDSLSAEPQPWEFRAKPAWQRLIVMMGGIIVNVLTGIVIFILLTYNYGETYLPAKEVKYGIVAHELGQQIGFRTGDRILAINGKPFTEFNEVYNPEVFFGKDATFTVDRNGQQVNVAIPADFLDRMLDKNQQRFVEPLQPFKVGKVVPGNPAAKAGLQAGDLIRSINGEPVQFFHELQEALARHKEQQISMVVERAGKELTLTPKVDSDGRIGFQPEILLQEATRHYSLAEAVPVGAAKAFSVVSANVKGFAKIFRGEVSASKSVSGPLGIAQVFGGTFNWQNFWFITGMLSMVLAFMNFLPIPALDGGHVMFPDLRDGDRPQAFR